MTPQPGHKLFKTQEPRQQSHPIQEAKQMGAETLIKMKRNLCVYVCVYWREDAAENVTTGEFMLQNLNSLGN